MTIVPICGHNEEAEYLLRSAAARVKWADNGRGAPCHLPGLRHGSGNQADL